jgi:hypothetical protein
VIGKVDGLLVDKTGSLESMVYALFFRYFFLGARI